MPTHGQSCCLIALVATLSATLLACTGSTRETLNIRPGGRARLAVPIIVEKVTASPDAPGLIAARTMRIGAFNLDDLANIRGSLVDTLRAAADPASTSIDDRLRLSVVIRRYLVAHSNNAGGVLAAVDWCAARDDGSAIYREIFYATAEGQLVTTLGEVKNRAQRAIVRRVAESALRLAAVGATPNLPVAVEGTYDDLSAATTTLPATLKSVAVSPFVGSNIAQIAFVGLDIAQNVLTRPTAIPWGEARTEGSISCQQLQDPERAGSSGRSPGGGSAVRPRESGDQ